MYLCSNVVMQDLSFSTAQTSDYIKSLVFQSLYVNIDPCSYIQLGNRTIDLDSIVPSHFFQENFCAFRPRSRDELQPLVAIGWLFEVDVELVLPFCLLTDDVVRRYGICFVSSNKSSVTSCTVSVQSLDRETTLSILFCLW